ncbi:MAG: hypothetical protein WD078_11845, partial [Woeseia sp.]
LRHTVTPFTESDTEGYLRRCVSLAGGDFGSIFASGTVAALHACSGGIPRVLNNICESVLTEAADRGERPVTAALVSTVASDVYGIEVLPGFAGTSAEEEDATNTNNDAGIDETALAASVPAESDDASSDAARDARDARTVGSGEEPIETDTATAESASAGEEAVYADGPQSIPDSADIAEETEIAHEAADTPVDELAERRLAAPPQPARSHQDLPELGELLARIGATGPKADTLAVPEEYPPDTPPETAVDNTPEQAATGLDYDGTTESREAIAEVVAEEIPADDRMPEPVNFAEGEILFEPDIDEETVTEDAAIQAVAEATLVSDDDRQEPVYVADDDDTLEAPILDEQEVPSIDEVLAAPEKQERESAPDDDIPVLTAEMHVATANDEENAISLADTSGDLEHAEVAGDAMPDFLAADIDELELALSVTHDTIEESPDGSQEDARAAGELPEITLDNELDKKKAPAPVTNLSRWQEELALANGLEDISDVLAETVFGDKEFDELAAQIALTPDPDQLDSLSLAEESPPSAPVRAAAAPAPPVPAATVSQQDRSGAWKFDMSVSRRFELVKELGRAQKEREINAHSMVEITLGEDGYPVDASQGPVPDPIEVQIDTEITQSRMALKPDDIEKLAAQEETPPEPEKESRGLFGLFRRSSKS